MPSESTESQTTHTTKGSSVKEGTNREDSLPPTVKILGDILALELEDRMLNTDDIDHKNIFKSDTDDEKVKLFLAESDLYLDGRWTDLRNVIDHAESEHRSINEEELCAPFMKILNAIFEFFNYPDQGRRLVDTDDAKGLRIRSHAPPDFMVMGEGPHFHAANAVPESAGYTHCASMGAIKTEKNQTKTDDCLQVGVYARQCFIQQQHRRYVFGAITCRNVRSSSPV